VNVLRRVGPGSQASDRIENLASRVIRSGGNRLGSKLAARRDDGIQHRQIIGASNANLFTVEPDFEANHTRGERYCSGTARGKC